MRDMRRVPTSWIMVVLIGLGAIIVALGNIGYQKTSAAENLTSKANQARALLQPELARNLHKLAEAESAFANGRAWIGRFYTTAWKTIASGGLLFGLPDSELAALLQVYRLLNEANENLIRLEDHVMGVPGALTGSDNLVEFCRQEARASLAGLRHALSTLPPALLPATETESGDRL